MRIPAAAAIVAIVLVLAVPAGATIVPQRSLKGVRLDMSEQQVRAKLGNPDRVRHPVSDVFGKYTSWYYGRTRINMFDGNKKVFDVTTTSRAEKTRSGVGIGSSVAAVKRGVKRVKCELIFGTRHCHVGRFDPGRKVTDFIIARSGRVKRVTYGYVID
jgi:hypothetical protein